MRAKDFLACAMGFLALPAAIALFWDSFSAIRDGLLAGAPLVLVPYGGWADAVVPVMLLAGLTFVLQQLRKARPRFRPPPGRAAKVVAGAALGSLLLGGAVIIVGDLMIVPAVGSLIIEKAGYVRCPSLDRFASRGKTQMAAWAQTQCPA